MAERQQESLQKNALLSLALRRPVTAQQLGNGRVRLTEGEGESGWSRFWTGYVLVLGLAFLGLFVFYMWFIASGEDQNSTSSAPPSIFMLALTAFFAWMCLYAVRLWLSRDRREKRYTAGTLDLPEQWHGGQVVRLNYQKKVVTISNEDQVPGEVRATLCLAKRSRKADSDGNYKDSRGWYDIVLEPVWSQELPTVPVPSGGDFTAQWDVRLPDQPPAPNGDIFGYDLLLVLDLRRGEKEMFRHSLELPPLSPN